MSGQEPHEDLCIQFLMPGRIPRWFEQRSRGPSISFWFRGKCFPDYALCVAILLRDDLHCNPIKVTSILTINGIVLSGRYTIQMEQLLVSSHLSFGLGGFDYRRALLFENEWNHAEFSYKAQQRSEGEYDVYHDVQIQLIAKEIGMHVQKRKSSVIMPDIRFTDPYKMRGLIVMMMTVSMVLPNYNNQPLNLETRIGLWTLLFLTHSALGTNTLT
ncbi:hypothetical protein PIB30_092809 [Stylosanthes scabra]|uniref:Uncharacterized protein n=1 Tax=Stylosanthes scabra TaxID=79078 RepID=A0ABU6VVX0_9FABA|nr:hypothetical protein [Stylosanthes scabra]